MDAIVLGAGVIGLSLALELRRNGLSVLVLEKHEPAREASHAAAGMLAPKAGDLPPALAALGSDSARLYPDFVREIEDASGHKVDLRAQGTILVGAQSCSIDGATPLSTAEQNKLEPALEAQPQACFIEESTVDPRALCAAALKAALHHGVKVASGARVATVTPQSGSFAVATSKATYHAPVVVNCCGAWAGQVSPLRLPTRPVKGQMLSVVPESKSLISHVIFSEHVYLVPRSSGLILIGATVEDVGFDKRVDPATIESLHRAALALVPEIVHAQIHEAWAGLRPGTPDGLPILGATDIPGYFIATGHFRNGILLAPITAQIMAQLIVKQPLAHDITAFSPARFAD